MSRKARLYGKTGVYHVIVRGNNQQNIFYEDNDRLLFIKKMKKYSKQLSITIHAYCLMNNHVHILIGNANLNMSKFMLKLNTSYSRNFNLKYERTGHLFQGRYLSNPIKNDTEFKLVLRYILKNPEKVGLGNYKEYKWNNFQEIIKKLEMGNENNIIKVFNNLNELKNFMMMDSKENFMEDINVKYMSDTVCFNLIKKLLNIENPHLIIRFEKRKQIKIISILKKAGITQSQISRITGLSRYIIKTA